MDYFLSKIYRYEFITLCSYSISLNARKILLNIWNYCFPMNRKTVTDIIDDTLLFEIINYNNKFFSNKIEVTLIDNIKYKYYFEENFKILQRK